MIPTVIVVNDNNHELQNLHAVLRSLLRTFHRSSLDGEKLYGVYEGILYFDEFGNRQFKRVDDYSDVLQLVLNKLANIPAKDKALLKGFLKGQAVALPSQITKGGLEASLQLQLDRHIQDIYG